MAGELITLDHARRARGNIVCLKCGFNWTKGFRGKNYTLPTILGCPKCEWFKEDEDGWVENQKWLSNFTKPKRRAAKKQKVRRHKSERRKSKKTDEGGHHQDR